jgi:hypothetical protein
MFFGMRDLLLHPDAFFTQAVQGKVNLIPPFLILGAGVVINVVMILLVFIAPGPSGYSAYFLTYGGLQRDILLSFIFRSIFIPFGLWGFGSVAACGISRVCSGRGSFSATIQNLGYGMLPWTLSMVVPVVSVVVKFSTDNPGGFSGIWLTAPYVSCIVNWVVLIWISCLWIFAIRYTHRFSFGKAMGAVIISVVASYGAYMALSYLFQGIRIGFIPLF